MEVHTKQASEDKGRRKKIIERIRRFGAHSQASALMRSLWSGVQVEREGV